MSSQELRSRNGHQNHLMLKQEVLCILFLSTHPGFELAQAIFAGGIQLRLSISVLKWRSGHHTLQRGAWYYDSVVELGQGTKSEKAHVCMCVQHVCLSVKVFIEEMMRGMPSKIGVYQVEQKQWHSNQRETHKQRQAPLRKCLSLMWLGVQVIGGREEEKNGEVMIEDEAAEVVGTRLGLAVVCSAVCILF